MSVSLAQVLLLGGGFTLERVAALLPRNSYVISSRNFEKVRAWQQKGWSSCIIDVALTETITGALKSHPNVHTVIDSVPPDRMAQDSNAEAVKRAQLLKSLGIKRVVYLSTTGVFGVEDGSWVNEDTKSNPKHVSAKARLNFELAYTQELPKTTILRLPAIYGPGRGTGHSLKAGRYPYIEDGQRWSNRIHVDDLARIIVALYEKNPSESLFCVSDGNPAKIKDIVTYYCKNFNLQVPTSITIDEAKERGMHTVLSNQRVDASRIYKTLGVTLEFPSYIEGAKSEMQYC